MERAQTQLQAAEAAVAEVLEDTDLMQAEFTEGQARLARLKESALSASKPPHHDAMKTQRTCVRERDRAD